jgi:hypothetical protein
MEPARGRLLARFLGGGGHVGSACGECGENVESFCSRGRSAYVGFSCLFLLAPVRGGTSFLQTRKETKQRNAFQTANTLVSSLVTSGFWHETISTTKHLTRRRTPTSSTNGAHTLRLHGPNPLLLSATPAVESAVRQVTTSALRQAVKRPTTSAPRQAARPAGNHSILRGFSMVDPFGSSEMQSWM